MRPLTLGEATGWEDDTTIQGSHLLYLSIRKIPFLFWLQSLSYSTDGEKSPHVHVKGEGVCGRERNVKECNFQGGRGAGGRLTLWKICAVLN